MPNGSMHIQSIQICNGDLQFCIVINNCFLIMSSRSFHADHRLEDFSRDACIPWIFCPILSTECLYFAIVDSHRILFSSFFVSFLTSYSLHAIWSWNSMRLNFSSTFFYLFQIPQTEYFKWVIDSHRKNAFESKIFRELLQGNETCSLLNSPQHCTAHYTNINVGLGLKW